MQESSKKDNETEVKVKKKQVRKPRDQNQKLKNTISQIVFNKNHKDEHVMINFYDKDFKILYDKFRGSKTHKEFCNEMLNSYISFISKEVNKK